MWLNIQQRLCIGIRGSIIYTRVPCEIFFLDQNNGWGERASTTLNSASNSKSATSFQSFSFRLWGYWYSWTSTDSLRCTTQSQDWWGGKLVGLAEAMLYRCYPFCIVDNSEWICRVFIINDSLEITSMKLVIFCC